MLSLLVSLSLAAPITEPIALDFTVPTTVKMFQEVRLTKAVGKAKGKDCAGALADARADLARVMSKNGMTDVIAIYTLNDRKGWAPVTEVTCELNGPADAPKSSEVKLEALLTKAGSDAAYGDVAGIRVTEMMDALVGSDQGMIGYRMMGMKIDANDGKLWYHVNAGARDEEFPTKSKRNRRVVTTFREVMTPKIQQWCGKLASVTEVEGLWLEATASRKDEKGETQTEYFHFRVPSSAANDFASGKITEQNLVDAGVFLEGRVNPIRIDVSFAAADE